MTISDLGSVDEIFERYKADLYRHLGIASIDDFSNFTEDEISIATEWMVGYQLRKKGVQFLHSPSNSVCKALSIICKTWKLKTLKDAAALPIKDLMRTPSVGIDSIASLLLYASERGLFPSFEPRRQLLRNLIGQVRKTDVRDVMDHRGGWGLLGIRLSTPARKAILTRDIWCVSQLASFAEDLLENGCHDPRNNSFADVLQEVTTVITELTAELSNRYVV